MSMTASELIKKIFDVEKVSISINGFENPADAVFDDYPYDTPMDGDKTADDLMNERIRPILATGRPKSANA